MRAPSLHRPMPIADVPHWDFETDVAIVGFGATGACAAIEARESGANVILFERNSGSGGASASIAQAAASGLNSATATMIWPRCFMVRAGQDALAVGGIQVGGAGFFNGNCPSRRVGWEVWG